MCLCKRVCMDPSMCVWLAGWFVVYPLFPSFLILASLPFGTLLWFPPLGPGRYRQERAQLGFPGLSGQRSGSIPGLGRKACLRDRGFLPGLGPLCLWPSVSTWRSHLCLQGFLPEPPFQDFSSDGPTKDTAFALLTPTRQHRHRAPGRSLSFRDSRFPEPGLGPAVSSEDRGQGPSDCRGSTLWRGGPGCGSLVPAVPSWESSCCSLAALSCSFPIQTIHSQGPSLHRLQGAPPGPHFDCC